MQTPTLLVRAHEKAQVETDVVSLQKLREFIKARWTKDLECGELIHNMIVANPNCNGRYIADQIPIDKNWVYRHHIYYILVLGLRRISGQANLLPPYSISTTVDIDTLKTLVDLGISINFDFQSATVAEWKRLQKDVDEMLNRTRKRRNTVLTVGEMQIQDATETADHRQTRMRTETTPPTPSAMTPEINCNNDMGFGTEGNQGPEFPRLDLIENAENKIKEFHEKLETDISKPCLRRMPPYVFHKISKICFLESKYDTGKSKAEYQLNRSAVKWLFQKAPSARILPPLPFPSRLLERIYFKFIWDQEDWSSSENIICRAPNGGIFFAWFRQCIPSDLVAHVAIVTERLVADLPPHQTYQNGRGSGQYYQFGYHRNSSPHVMSYSHMTDKAFLIWTNQMRPYFEWVRAILKKHIPTMMDLKQDQIGPKNPLSPFTAGQINKDTQVGVHLDENDLSGTLNALMTYGKYQGGELILPDLNISIGIQPGDLILFEGSRIRHGVTPIQPEDRRTSIDMYVNTCSYIPSRSTLMPLISS